MAKNPKEDLFADSTMTFGEHLEELRQCLFRAAIGLVVGVGFGLFLADSSATQEVTAWLLSNAGHGQDSE